MDLLIDSALLLFLIATALMIVKMHDLFAIVMVAGIYSLASSCLFIYLDAVDVAFTEASVGAGIATILLLATLSFVAQRERRKDIFQPVPFVLVLIMGIAVIYGLQGLPAFGDAGAPIHQHVANYYIERSQHEMGIPNIVTSILASYRGFDTLGETTVVFTATIAVMVLLGAAGTGKKGGPRS